MPRRVLDVLLKRYEKESEATPRDPIRFSGTLLDDVSFGVDVEEWGLPDEHAAIKEARRSKRGRP